MPWEQTVTFIGVVDLEAADAFFLRLGLLKVATQHNSESVPMVYIYRSTPDAFLGITNARASICAYRAVPWPWIHRRCGQQRVFSLLVV
eukprot:COSAG02_NODE_35_length_49339_cov_20.375102_30_plen_89_part_00